MAAADEDANVDPTEPEPGAAVLAGCGLQVTKTEWEAIEEVPQAVRRVGALFQVSAQELLTVEGCKELGRTTSTASNLSTASTVGFDDESWSTLTGDVVKSNAKTTSKKKIDLIRKKRLEELLKADKARLSEELAEDRMPKLERYGNRFESFLAAALAWLEQKKRPRTQAATTALHLHAAALKRFGSLPDTVQRRFAVLIGGVGCKPATALQEICEHEEYLTGLQLLEVDLTLHDDQREFVSLLLAASQDNTALLLRYQTPPSGGKTSCVALLGACLQMQQRRHVIYGCYSRQVRIDVCKHCLATSVPFAIVVQGVASPHNSCYHGRPPRSEPPPIELAKRVEWSARLCRKCDRFPVVLICDLASALLLLQHRSEDVLLFDEPTADVAPGMQADVRRLLRQCPAITALMSAGVPDFDAMPSFVEHYRRRHPEASLKTVACERLPMSVTALDAQERIWAPHHLGVTPDVIASDGHLLRFYSPRVLRQLVKEKHDISFSDLLSYTSVRAACLRLLRAKAGNWELPPETTTSSLQLPHFCSNQAWRLPGASLIILDNVADFLLMALQPNMAGLPSLRRILKAEDQLQKAEEKRQESELRRSAASTKKMDKDVRKALRDDALPRSETWNGDPNASVELWPSSCIVNTLEHLTKHAAEQAKVFPNKWLRSALPLPYLVRHTSEETVVEAALCGVLPFGGLGDTLYETIAQTLAEQARESFVVANSQLIYGLNLPFERVIVACKPLHYLDMKQLIGRAGRTGRLAKAEAVFLQPETMLAAMVPPSQASLVAAAAANFTV